MSGDASIKQAPAEGVMFDNLDGQRFYDPCIFYYSRLAIGCQQHYGGDRRQPLGSALGLVSVLLHGLQHGVFHLRKTLRHFPG